MASSLKPLVGKLDTTCKNALEAAAGLCVSRTHYDVDIEHFLLKLLDNHNTDLHAIFRHHGVDLNRLDRDLNRALDGFKRGNSRTPSLSPNIPRAIELAWVIASIDFNAGRIRSGHIIVALLADKTFARTLSESSKEFANIQLEELKSHFSDITSKSDEADSNEPLAFASDAQTDGESQNASGGQRAAGKTPFLDQYCVNLTQRALQGKMDPVLGRDAEIRQMIDILTRRRQNNPILTGEAGVGKTAVVEGLALRIAKNDVPTILQGVQLQSLDLGLLQAGASVKGEFENRLRGVIDDVKRSTQPVIVFIDEAHTLIGAGGQAGQNDAANLLKPALARGEMRTIAATTWSEYKKYFEKDPALARRFQVVKVDEPDEAKGIAMLRGVADSMELHHGVRILDEAVVEAVCLSNRYISGRQLPDKAVSVLDTACARINIGQNATPGEIEDAQRRIDIVKTEMRVLERESTTGSNHAERLAELSAELEATEKLLAELSDRWIKEKHLVGQLTEVRAKLENIAETIPEKDRETSSQELTRLRGELRAIQGDSPLVQPVVDSQTVAGVISAWTGIPVGKMLKDEISAVLVLEQTLEERVIGQSHAIRQIAQRIKTSRAKLEDPNKPIGVFLLVGTSGVGKTETALTLADVLYGGERNMVTINMSEYQEAHTVSSLKGSPPGYVGFGEGGVLTEAVRRKPYCVVLLDEVEKAHPDVLELFFQVFDKGVMDDAEGREINFRNTVIILTSNVGTNAIMDMCTGDGDMPSAEQIIETIRPELNHVFKPAFVGRTSVIPYYPLHGSVLKHIVQLKLNKIKKRILANHRAVFEYGDDLIQHVADRCTEPDSGARNIDNILSGALLPEISVSVLAKMAEGNAVSKISVGIDAGELRFEVS